MDRGKEILYIILGRRRTGKRIPVGWVKLHSSAQIEVVEYRYDGIGRRVEKIVNGIVTEYIYDRENVIWEYNSSNELQRANIYTLNVDEILQTTVGANSYYYNSDHLGSITEITNSSGTVVEKYDYRPFGKPYIINPQTGSLRQTLVIGNRYLFTAREWGPETQLYYYRARYYAPRVGRFLRRDPIGFDGGVNFYIYVKNNPVNLIDPSGTIVRLCDVDGPMWQDILNFTHTFIEVYGRMGYVGSWGFYPRDYESQNVRDRVKAGEAVPGFVRRDDAGYTYLQRGMNYKCKAKSTDDRYDECVRFFAESEANRYDLWFKLYPPSKFNCKDWAKKVLTKCDVKKDKEDNGDDCPWWWPPCWFKSASSLSPGGASACSSR